MRESVARHHVALSEAEGPELPGLIADRDFHFLIAQASRNPLPTQLLCHELYPLLQMYRARTADRPAQPARPGYPLLGLLRNTFRIGV